jgi:hypothetical protein
MDEALKKQVEWVRGEFGHSWCPSCSNRQDKGHITGCALDGWLKADSYAALHQTQPAQPLSDLAAKQDILRKLAKDPSISVRKSVARNEWIPQDVIDLLAKDPSKEVLYVLVQNPIIPAETLRVLAQVKTGNMRYYLRQNRNLPSDAIDLIYKGTTSYYDHNNLINLPNVSDDTLKAISAKYKNKISSGYSINYIHLNAQSVLNKRAKAKTQLSPIEKLRALPIYKRAAAARNDVLSLDAVQMLANDKNPSVRASMAEGIKPNLNASAIQVSRPTQVESDDAAIPATIPINPSDLKIGDKFLSYEEKDGNLFPTKTSRYVRMQILTALSKPDHGDITVAWNSGKTEFLKLNDDDDLIPELSEEGKALLVPYNSIAIYGASGHVIQKLVEPIKAPEPTKSITAEDVWSELATHPDVYARISAAKRVPSSNLDVLKRLAYDTDESVCGSLFINRNTPLPVLEILALHKSKAIRKRVVQETHCSPELWQLLARDTEWEVREAAASNPKVALAKEPEETKVDDAPVQPTTEVEHIEPKPTQTVLGSALLMGAGMLGGAMASAMFSQSPSVRVAEIEPVETLIETVQETISNVAQ